MAYRGRDLDLRLSTHDMEAHKSALGELPLSHTSSHTGRHDRNSFFVDDSVLECFNHAYDVAAAHCAAEVRIAHMLLAATRIPETTAALRKHGIDVSGLMRDAAAEVAQYHPTNSGDHISTPVTSTELEDVLQAAGMVSDHKQQPIDAEDLVGVLFDLRLAAPSKDLLVRNSRQAEIKGRIDVRDTPRDRIRMPRGDATYGSRPTTRATLADTATDSIQNSRLDALEHMVRALGADLSKERQTVVELLNDLQFERRPVESHPAPTYVDYTYPTPAEPVATHSNDDAILARIDAVMAEMSRLSHRLANIENEIKSGPVSDADLGPVLDRLESVEAALRDVQKERGHDLSDVGDRIADLETLISDRGSIDVDLKPVTDRLQLIEEAVMNADSDGNASLEAQLKALETRVANSAAVSDQARSELVRDLKVISEGVSGQRSEFTQKLSQLEIMLEAEIGRDREDTSEYVHEVGQVHEALMKLNTNQHTLAKSLEAWREANTRDLSAMSSKIQLVAAEANKPMQLLETMSANMDGMYRTIVARYHRRNRFWYWLLGTDDWVTASWPSTSARIDAERGNFRI